MKGDWETERDYINKLLTSCTSEDYEKNGIRLDEILDEFLRDRGFDQLADSVASVKCWRA